MARKIAAIDIVLFLTLVVFFVFFRFCSDKILNNVLDTSIQERNDSAMKVIALQYPNTRVSYLRTYFRTNETKELFSEYLVVAQDQFIKRVVGIWEDEEFRIVAEVAQNRRPEIDSEK